MKAGRKSTALVVRPRSVWRQCLMLSLAAFGLTVAAVYLISLNFFHKADCEGGSKAVAVMVQKPATDQDEILKKYLLQSPLNFKNIKTRIMSPAFMQLALRECAIDISQAVGNGGRNEFVSLEQLRRGLDVQTKPGADPSEFKITLELTLKQSSDAPRIAQALADRFVHEYRTYWATEMREVYLSALDRADQAQQAHREALEKLHEFKDSALKQVQSSPEQPQPTETQTTQQTTQATADNPAWVELNDKLASLRRQEANMLEDKTPLHPDIQSIRGRIADFERQLASTPRFDAESAKAQAMQQANAASRDNRLTSEEKENTNQERKTQEDIAAGVDQNDATETLKQLQEAVQRTELEYREQLHREQQIFGASRDGPIFSVDVKSLAMARPEPKSNRRLMELMLLSGFAMALGMSVFSSGVAAEPVVASIADLEPLLPAPIIGLVPSKDQSFDPVARRRRQTIFRWTRILFGGLIIMGSVGGVCGYFAYCN